MAKIEARIREETKEESQTTTKFYASMKRRTYSNDSIYIEEGSDDS